MSAITPMEALRRLIVEVKQLDAIEIGTNWNQLQGELGVAEGVVRDYVEPKPVGWLVFADDHNGMTPQFPAYEAKLQATRYAAMFGQTATEVRPVYAAPGAVQPSETVPIGYVSISALSALAEYTKQGMPNSIRMYNDVQPGRVEIQVYATAVASAGKEK